ncbi:MAG: hypothetical protein VW937_06100, partial [Actinomycetota bacterium]
GGALRASVVSSTHRGAKVTDVHWSPAGDALTCGDDRGVVSALLLDASDADSPEPAASVLANPHDVSVDHEVTLDVLTQILTTPRP